MSSNNNYRLHLKAVQIFKTTGIQDMTKTETRNITSRMLEQHCYLGSKQLNCMRVMALKRSLKRGNYKKKIAFVLLFLLKVFKNSEIYFKNLKYRQKSDIQQFHLSQKLMAALVWHCVHNKREMWHGGTKIKCQILHRY